MKKAVVILIAAVFALSALCVPALASTPSLEASESIVTKHAAMWGFGFNGGAKFRDFNYSADFNAETAGGGTIVTVKDADAAVAATQVVLWNVNVASTTGACGFVATGPNARKNIMGEETDSPDSVYCATLKLEVDGGLGDAPVGSFCIAMAPDSAKWGKKLNGFDLYLCNDTDISLESCKLAYHADNLVTMNLWETSDDGTFAFFEANLDEPMLASYAVLALRTEDVLTTFESFVPGSTAEGDTWYSFLIGEIALFSTTLDGKEVTVAGQQTEPETADPGTQAPETQAPVTQAPETKAPETQAPTTQEPAAQAPATQAPQSGDGSPKKGCGGSAALAAVICCSAAGAAFFRRKREL